MYPICSLFAICSFAVFGPAPIWLTLSGPCPGSFSQLQTATCASLSHVIVGCVIYGHRPSHHRQRFIGASVAERVARSRLSTRTRGNGSGGTHQHRAHPSVRRLPNTDKIPRPYSRRSQEPSCHRLRLPDLQAPVLERVRPTQLAASSFQRPFPPVSATVAPQRLLELLTAGVSRENSAWLTRLGQHPDVSGSHSCGRRRFACNTGGRT